MIDYDEAEGQIYFYVHVTAKAKRPGVGGEYDSALRVAVTAPADQGKANAAVLKTLAKFFSVRRADLTLVSGQTNRRKRIGLQGMSAERFTEVLQDLDNDG
ncbi:hypothetical protein FF011L_47310 [Roseimaritima multifibrata]|uniref:UPF0235 protein FF011L_47310 n=1 Tax=Roseimaritima multifibrata TaxID=1930274 RepID=A0A517MM39_9BACT|nr:DUF167 domain-containing protein [Roseimaritima multifibrata]QDS95929.1 hypothetical protein FF011L_47310 [Roseimaritima multifibrata]